MRGKTGINLDTPWQPGLLHLSAGHPPRPTVIIYQDLPPNPPTEGTTSPHDLTASFSRRSWLARLAPKLQSVFYTDGGREWFGEGF